VGTSGKNKGFSLIELMIAVAIVGILARLAYPAYLDQIRKGHRSSAQNFMMTVAQAEQQYLLDSHAYAVGSSALTTLSQTVPTDVSTYYTLTITPSTPASPPVFTINAAPNSGTSQAPDGTLTLDQFGNKTRAGQNGW
jgi:type IV pilus assembly protein PilE